MSKKHTVATPITSVTYTNGPALVYLNRVVKEQRKKGVEYSESIKITEYSDGSVQYLLSMHPI